MVSFDSVEKRRRLLRYAPECGILLIFALVAWRILVPPAETVVQAPPLELARLDQSRFRLADFRGRVVFLDFWATWCPPCQASLPLVEAFAKAHPEITVVPVNVGESPAVARTYAESRGLQNVVVNPDSSVVAAFHLTGFPTIVAIDEQGRIVDRWYGYRPDIGTILLRAKSRYDLLRRARNDAMPSAHS